MDASQLPKGQSKEKSDGRPVNEPGIYQHKDTKGIYITAEGEEGSVQADYLTNPLWKDAWERVGDVPSRVELLKMRKIQQLKDAKEDAVAKQAEEAEIAAAVEAATTKLEKEPAKPAPGTGFNVPSVAK